MSLIARALLVTLRVCATASADETRTERVQFQKGANSATVEGRIKGYASVDYVLGARKGQSMNVSMAMDNGEFTARDGAPLQVSKDADTWTITANGNKHYRFADALISGG